ncbi:MAG: HEPN domain-containing protein [bacterium]|nr:HEPN domain-containing protein [bacterium]
MKEEPKLKIVRRWLLLANADLVNAENVLKLDLDQTYTTICFHAQQCVEKMVKAVLVLNEIDTPKSHDLNELVNIMRPYLDISDILPNPGILTPYAVTTRYPGTWMTIQRHDAVIAVN